MSNAKTVGYGVRVLPLICLGLVGCAADEPESSHEPREGKPDTLGFTISRETTYITEPLMADGTPDYAAVLNAKHGAGVTPENNAAALLVPVLGIEFEEAVLRRMGVDTASLPEGSRLLGGWHADLFEEYVRTSAARGEGPVMGDKPKDLAKLYEAFDSELRWDEWGQHERDPCSEEDCPLLAKWLAANEGPLNLIAKAARRPRYWVPLEEGVAQHQGTLVPSYGAYRTASLALHGRAMLHLDSEDWEAAAEDILTSQRLAALLAQGGWLFEPLFGIAVRNIATLDLPRLAASSTLRAPAAERLLEALRRLSLPELHITLDQERFSALGSVIALRQLGTERGSDAWAQVLGWIEDLPSGVYEIPVSAVEWDEALRLVNQAHDLQSAVVRSTTLAEHRQARARLERELAWRDGAERSLEPPRLTQLLRDAGRDREARLELTKALVSAARLLEPGFLRAQVSLNESRAQFRAGLVALALGTFQAQSGGFPADLEDLVPDYLTEAWGTGTTRDGYVFRYHPGPPLNGKSSFMASFAHTAVPEQPVETGVRGFCVDDTGWTVATLDGTEPLVLDGRCQEIRKEVATRADADRPASVSWLALYGGHIMATILTCLLLAGLWRQRPQARPGQVLEWAETLGRAVRSRPRLALALAASFVLAVVYLWSLGPSLLLRVLDVGPDILDAFSDSPTPVYVLMGLAVIGLQVAVTVLLAAAPLLLVRELRQPGPRTQLRRGLPFVAAIGAGLSLAAWLGAPLSPTQRLFLGLVVGVGLVLIALHVIGTARGWQLCRRPEVLLGSLGGCLGLMWLASVPLALREFGTQRDRQTRRVEAARREITKLVIMAGRLDGLQAEIVAVEYALIAARRLLPVSLGVPELWKQLRKSAAASGVSIQGGYYETENEKLPYQMATVTLFLVGKPDAIAALARNEGEPGRLIRWTKPKPTATGAELNLEVFGLPEAPSPPGKGLCDNLDEVWIPSIRDNFLSACDRLDELRKIQRLVDGLEARKLHLQRLRGTIEMIRSEREQTD